MKSSTATRPRLTAKGAATRERIVAGAARHVRQHGVPHTTLDDVCAATATSKGQLFHYFPGGREELLLAVAQHEASWVIADQEPHLSEATEWSDWWSWRDSVLARYVAQGPDCPLGALLTELGRASPATLAVTRRLLDEWRDLPRDAIRRMQHSGHITADVDADRCAAAFVAGIQGGVVILMATGSAADLEAALDLALAHLGAPPR